MRHFQIRRGGGNHRHRQTGDLAKSRLVGDGLPGAGSHRPAQRFQAECLRRLRGPQPGAIDRPRDGALRHPLQGVGDGGCRDRRATLRGGSRTAIEKLRLGQRTRAVVDDHDLDPLRQRRQSRAHGVLPPLTAGDDGLHLGEALVADELAHRLQGMGPGDDHDRTDGLGLLQRAERPGQHRPPGQGKQHLLRRAKALATPGGHHHRGHPLRRREAVSFQLRITFPLSQRDWERGVGGEGDHGLTAAASRSAATAASGTGAEPSSRAARRSGPW